MNGSDAVDGRPNDDREVASAGDLDADPMLSSPADIESAGRSCMAILVLAAVVILILLVWIGLRSTGAGQ
jgi:cobalamin biosynthesis Mg chelatase CobN